MAKALFLLKRREDYSQNASYSSSNQIATGMWNSSKFVVDALQEVGIDAVVEVVVVFVFTLRYHFLQLRALQWSGLGSI